MALEDRCSPQSANSPPGLPQSPQSNSHPFQHHHHQSNGSSPCPTTSMLMLINNVIDSKTKLNAAAMDYETQSNTPSNGSLKSSDMSPTQLLSSIASKNLFNIQNQFMFQTHQNSHNNNSEKHNSPPATPMRTDDEDEEDEDEIDIENDTVPKVEVPSPNGKFLSPASPASSQHSSHSPQISSSSPTSPSTTSQSGNLKFSITQILSDNFGIESKFHQHAMASAVAQLKSAGGQHPLQQYPFYHPAAAAAMAAGMMMPGGPHQQYHHPHFPHNLPPHHPLLFRPYEADLELRNQQAAAAAAAAQQKMKNNFSSLFSSFQQSQQQSQNNGTRTSLEDFCDSKLSQLSSGNGSNISSNGRPVISSNSSLISNSSSNTSNNNGKGATTATAGAHRASSTTSSVTGGGGSMRPDSGVDSSDDTKSETGSTKDENGQSWPAWIYCTRYSDRPSSGKNRHFIDLFGFI